TSKYFDEVEKKSQTKSPSNTGVRDKTVRRIQPVLIVKDIIPNSADEVFEDFLKACANYEKADEETKVILEKLQKKYNKLDSFNKDDRDFILFLRNRLNNITHKKAKFYQTIFEVREEISRRIIKLKKDKSTREKGSESDTEPKYTKDELKKIKILEKVIKECRRRIKELETADVIFDDDDDSAYLKEDRYKRKYVQLCQALSDIARDKKLKSEIMKKKITLNDIQDEMTGIKAIDQSIINFVNISISRMNKLKHIQNFNAVPNYIVPPDFYEVLQIIEKHDETRNLQFTKQEIELYGKCMSCFR
ncbi:uncharacterized protein LOC111643774, partial [Copidosoma floridanum]|uniref:uncharacterized protein LOC111643774 n=1 Tax=Copidosoma floridanum TaxID=29053 RepID=UPI000C6F825F